MGTFGTVRRVDVGLTVNTAAMLAAPFHKRACAVPAVVSSCTVNVARNDLVAVKQPTRSGTLDPVVKTPAQRTCLRPAARPPPLLYCAEPQAIRPPRFRAVLPQSDSPSC